MAHKRYALHVLTLLGSVLSSLGPVITTPRLVLADSPDCPTGMVNYWKLDETTGAPFDDSYGGNSATCTSCPDAASGQVNGAQDFDGSADQLTTGNAEHPTSELTIMAWVNPDSVNDHDRGIVFKPDAFRFELESETQGCIEFSIYQSGVLRELSPNCSTPTSEWTHYAATFDGEYLRVYKNGAEVGSGYHAPGAIDGASDPYTIGYTQWSGQDRYFDGKLDEVTIFERALSLEEIQEHYNAGLEGSGYCRSPGEAVTWYLAEGFTGLGYETFILLQNPTAYPATVNVTYMLEGGGSINKAHTVPANSRYTILANNADEVGLDQAFSTRLTADQPIIAERAMYWPNGDGMIGGHEATGIAAPSSTWYFAEGFTGSGFETFILLQNPNDTAATVQVTYMLDDGTVIEKSHGIPANSRYTILANNAAEVGLDQAFSTKLVSDRPIIAERAMYFSNEGHDAAGVTVPTTNWYLAEGYTGDGMDTFILIQNPNPAQAAVTVRYMLQGGGVIETSHSVLSNSRYTIRANDIDQVGPDQAFAVEVVADQPVVVERAMYWPNGDGTIAGHATAGIKARASVWNLAEGFTGGSFQTFILMQNPNTETATVQVTYMLEGGGTIEKTHSIPPESRYTIVTQDVSEVGPDEAFATRLVADRPIVIERAMYFCSGGHVSAGVPE